MKKWFYTGLIIFFAFVFVISAGILAWYYIDAAIQQGRYNELSSMKENMTPRPTLPQDGETIPEATEPNLVSVINPITGKATQVLPEFASLYAENPDIVGWLTIPGTDIDYPVMQSPDRPDYYLHRDFDGQKHSAGCLYADEPCDILTPSDNVIIYGHRMKNGSMFARLDKYMDAGYCKNNPYIHFDTLQELHTYEVVAVFLTSSSVGNGFPYHEFVNAADDAKFDAYVARCKKLALFDTGVDASYGDKLITLSTCEYSQTNGRLVVVAKRIA